MNAAVVQDGRLANGVIFNIIVSDVGEDIYKIILEAKDSTFRFYAMSNPANNPLQFC